MCKHQIIKRGDGTYYVNFHNEELNIGFMLGCNYYKTQEEAMAYLRDIKRTEKELEIKRRTEVVYEE